MSTSSSEVSLQYRGSNDQSYLPIFSAGFTSIPAQRTPQNSSVSKDNPLSDLLTDELYTILLANDLINQKGLRDFMIRRIFKQLKAEKKMKTMEAIEKLQEIYPYLQTDTIRKIVYRVYPGSSKKPMF